jgi:hypothetical protein
MEESVALLNNLLLCAHACIPTTFVKGLAGPFPSLPPSLPTYLPTW